MKNAFSIFAIFYLATLSPAMAAKLLNHGGYVYDNNNNAIPGAAVTCSNTITTGTYTNVGGHFSINCPADEGITVSFTGHKDQTIPVDELDTPTSHGHVSNNRITLVDDATAIEEVTVRGCEINTAQGVKHASYNEQTGECVIDECITPKYALNNGECVLVDNSCIDELRYKTGVKEAKWTSDDFGDAVCEVTQCDTENGWTMGSTTDQCYVDVGAPCTLPGAEYVRSGIETTTWADKNGTPKCTVTECKSEYKLKTLYNGEPWCILKDDCMDTLPDKTGVSSAKYDDNSGTAVCTITSCQYPQYKLIDGACVDQTGQDCDDKNNNVGTYGMFKKEFTCILSECSDLTQEVDTKTNTCTSLLNQKCSPMHDDNVANAVWEEHNGTKVCVIKSCKNKYRTNAAGTKCEPIPKECTSADKQQVLAQTGVIAAGLNASEKCVPTDCKCGYTLKNEKCVEWTAADKACTDNANGAKTFEKQCSDKGKPYCQILSCEADYTEVKKNNKITKCASKRGEDCINTLSSQQRANAKTAHYKNKGGKQICVIDTCIDGYEPDKDGAKCTPVKEKDSDKNKNQEPCTEHGDKNATTAYYKKKGGKRICVIDTCIDGYEPDKDGAKCTPVKEKENKKDKKDKQDKKQDSKLSPEDQQKKIDELRDNAENMKAKEQSTPNKLLGAAGIGATGIGGMMLASGMAEQNADAESETAMRAYLATFHCNYGGGKNVPGGTENVELPGGNELIALYTEYVNLANDLKARKADLGMAPGIESEAILESATSGLYDDVAVGKTSGAYVSLARALMDPEGEDAKLWAAQKEKSAQQVKTGAITAGVGAAGSLIGNLAINSGKDKQNKVDEILNKYEKLKKPFQDLESDMNAIPAKKCSEFTGTTGTGDAPNCTCKNNNEFFAINNGGCMKCENDGAIVENNVCKCPTDKPAIKNNKCVAVEPDCKLTGLRASGSKCECIDGADHGDDNVCQCKSTHNQVGNECQLKVTTPITSVVNTNLFGGGIKALTTADLNIPQIKTTIRIYGDTAFESGSAKLTWEAEKALSKFMSQVNAANKAEQLPDTNFCIEIVGHTDRVPFKKSVNKTNQQLSQERADAVKKALLDLSIAPVDATNYKATGMGASECLKEIYDKDNEPQCRRVDITLTSGAKCTQ